MAKLVSTNPAQNYKVIGEVNISTREEILEAVENSNAAKRAWKNLGIRKRISLLQPIQNEFHSRTKEIAELISQETGKVYSEALGEAVGYVEEFQWFIDNVETALTDEITHEDTLSIHRITYEPYGTVGVITPWNFPFGMAIWGIFPNLLVGNTVVFKISEECPLVGKLIEEIILNHKLPKGVFSEVYGAGDIGSILSHSELNYIWFTGSSGVGKELYKIAAEKFIPALLEMGGSNPCIIFEDTDIKKAVPIVYDGRFYNCGQVCDAIKRLIVHEDIFDNFVEELRLYTERQKLGHPKKVGVTIASLVAKRQQDLLTDQIDDAILKGAKIQCGGGKPSSLEGAYFQPTLLTNITKDMKVWYEEVFGPVLPIIAFSTEEEAIDLANDTIYGLGSRVISQDIQRAQRVASQIDSGTVEINYGDRWLACNPFGGYKESGIGREHGMIGFKNLCQVKLISESK